MAPAASAAPADPASALAPAPAAGLRGAAVPLGVLGGVVAAFCFVGAVDPNTPGHYPVCPLLHYTGLYCPGCGGLRSAYAVAHGRFGTALGCNALAVAGYALFAVVWAVWCWRSVRGLPFRPALGRGHRWAIWGLLIGFGVVRNLPFGSVLAP
ncbi:DUF2752 domain-containing protein [Actinacidiphila sp. DG2A-62]|nr:DUF2752 domain-containing protein [Actinacidiphila sp. DG2A-62]MEC3993482.1 DUF2752 domain-containing protein [Actinacidiphila sp. DG2A-62]